MTIAEKIQLAIKHKRDPRVAEVYVEASRAWMHGAGRLENPYPPDTPDWLWWDLGWRNEQEANS